ncbi:hypothetical protein SBY92_004893 [Candida maltosa Xu316]|uniref:Knr4/Smi1-like domain-containing protein n=1 Tax=Candida maltosa (strain Xu316) TaxID=1245528 RepID=M3HEI2_CANMX|nr:hypothetical protein G210_4198 [Candida maltosa Xu316]
MTFLDSIKSFVHSITTDDHYASYGSNASNNIPVSEDENNNSSTYRLNNDSQYSLDNSSTAGFYRPGMKSSQQDLPLQNLNREGQPPLPSIDSLWDRIEYWIEQEYPELEDNLNDGVTTADLNEFIQDLQIGNTRNLPDDFRQFYKRHDGQLRGGKPTGLIMGLVLLDLEAIIEEKMLWTKVAQRLETQYYMTQHQKRQENVTKEGSSSNSNSNNGPTGINNSFIANQRSVPPNSIQPYYYHKGWVILLKDNIGNQVAMDLSPGPNGQWGQIILFGRDFDTKLVIASSLQEFIFSFVTDLEQGNFQIDSSEYQEQLGFLSNDRNGDFMVGDEDEDQGELSYWDKDGQEFGKNAVRGRLNYIEVLKRRALKKYGLSETFETTFIPQRQVKKPHPQQQQSGSGANTPILSQSRNVSASNLKKTATNGSVNKPIVSSPLANADASSSSFTVPKETIIDRKTVDEGKEKVKVESSEPKDPIESSEINLEETKEEDKEEPKPEVKEEPKEVKEEPEQPKDELKEESKPETDDEPKDELKEEDKTDVKELDEVKEDFEKDIKEEADKVADGLKEVEL